MGYERTPHDASGKAFRSNPDLAAPLRDAAPEPRAAEPDFPVSVVLPLFDGLPQTPYGLNKGAFHECRCV